ncbi:hypothetical protein IFM89_039765 [Coptis chinensis]|uniref:Uncharacterized protein n=1 Tax=Coptis chinensis TaxID=261450 RepID=A0A835LCU3_9MAGN|nr:hypothetical protein IFM89_039765 [Coptis chinensis]
MKTCTRVGDSLVLAFGTGIRKKDVYALWNLVNEIANIDWNNLEGKFIEDDLYEHINAPKWFDFSAPDDFGVHDEAWFCKAECRHPKTAEDYVRSNSKFTSKVKQHLRSISASKTLPFQDRNLRGGFMSSTTASMNRRVNKSKTFTPPQDRVQEDQENENPNLSTPSNSKNMKLTENKKMVMKRKEGESSKTLNEREVVRRRELEESLEDVNKLEVVEENKPLLEEEMKWNGRVLDVAIVILGLGGALDWFSVSLDAVHCCGGGRRVMLSVGGGGRNGVLTVDLVLETLSSEIPQVDANQKASWQYEEVILKRQIAENPSTDFAGTDIWESKVTREEQKTLNDEAEPEKDKGLYVGVQGNKLSHERSPQRDPDDGLGDIWREMSLALECSKDATGDTVENNVNAEKEWGHSFVLKDDLGYVCRVCGVIRKSMDTIFDFQWGRVSKTTRTYMSEPQSTKEREECGAPPSPS